VLRSIIKLDLIEGLIFFDGARALNFVIDNLALLLIVFNFKNELFEFTT
jgi:hypothetical protein